MGILRGKVFITKPKKVESFEGSNKLLDIQSFTGEISNNRIYSPSQYKTGRRETDSNGSVQDDWLTFTRYSILTSISISGCPSSSAVPLVARVYAQIIRGTSEIFSIGIMYAANDTGAAAPHQCTNAAIGLPVNIMVQPGDKVRTRLDYFSGTGTSRNITTVNFVEF